MCQAQSRPRGTVPCSQVTLGRARHRQVGTKSRVTQPRRASRLHQIQQPSSSSSASASARYDEPRYPKDVTRAATIGSEPRPSSSAKPGTAADRRPVRTTPRPGSVQETRPGWRLGNGERPVGPDETAQPRPTDANQGVFTARGGTASGSGANLATAGRTPAAPP